MNKIFQLTLLYLALFVLKARGLRLYKVESMVRHLIAGELLALRKNVVVWSSERCF